GATVGALLLGDAPALGDTLPLPQTDYEATAQIDQQSGIIRHHGGVLRVQTDDGPYITLVDLARHIATSLRVRLGRKVAIEMPGVLAASGGASEDHDARVVGSDTVAGEPCDIWRHVDVNPFPKPGAKTQLESDSCVTKDGIWLRTIDRDP